MLLIVVVSVTEFVNVAVVDALRDAVLLTVEDAVDPYVCVRVVETELVADVDADVVSDVVRVREGEDEAEVVFVLVAVLTEHFMKLPSM